LDRRSFLATLSIASLSLATGAGCASALPFRRERPEPATAFADVDFADWSEAEPEYRFYPGDQLDVATPSAPELNRSVTVGPDGRVSLPLIGQVMAADRSAGELQAALSESYSSQLVRPIVEVSLKQAGPLKVFVGGEVNNPGVYDMPGDIDALQAVIQAGGFKVSARRGEVGLIRRGRGDVRMLRRVDLSGRMPESVALKRFDIIYVPRSTLGEITAFMGQLRDSLPLGFSYSLNGQQTQ
jgi:polysaccharide export outer membrane protein